MILGIIIVVFCLSVLGIVHTYIIYPLYIKYCSKPFSLATTVITDYPEITIIIAAYNEEKVIEEKLHRTFQTHYPINKIKVLIGTDACSDNTVSIIRQLLQQYPNIQLEEFKERQGKFLIVNKLVDLATTDILILTDANVLFDENTLTNLVNHFSNNDVKLVCSNIIKNTPTKKEGIAEQEIFYLNFENTLKSNEYLKYGVVIGAEGGCYGLIKSFYKPVPQGFVVDDFFITMSVIEQGGKVVFDPKCICYEDVPVSTNVEFRRKARISTGNFKNLVHFKHLLYPFWKGVGFAFLSHKVLRWLTPLFLMLIFVTSSILAIDFDCFKLVVLGCLILFCMPIVEKALTVMRLRNKFIRFGSHFVMMNLALTKGFLNFISGETTSIWQPTKR